MESMKPPKKVIREIPEPEFTKLPPVRCVSCNKVLGNLYEKYREKLLTGEKPEVIFEELGLKRYCCRARLVNPICLPPGMIHYSQQTEEDVNKMIETHLIEPSKKINIVDILKLPGTSGLGKISSKQEKKTQELPLLGLIPLNEAEEKKQKLNRFKYIRHYKGGVPQLGGLRATKEE